MDDCRAREVQAPTESRLICPDGSALYGKRALRQYPPTGYLTGSTVSNGHVADGQAAGWAHVEDPIALGRNGVIPPDLRDTSTFPVDRDVLQDVPVARLALILVDAG